MPHVATCYFKCARVAAFCNILPQFAICCHMHSLFPMKVHSGELRHFCDDPVGPDLSGSFQTQGTPALAPMILCKLAECSAAMIRYDIGEFIIIIIIIIIIITTTTTSTISFNEPLDAMDV